MYSACFEIETIGDPPRPAAGALAIESLVVALSAIDEIYLYAHPETPELYMSGVRYVAEKARSPQRWFWDIPRILRKGYADCKALCAWRIAELSVQYPNRDFEPVITWEQYDNGDVLYHVRVMGLHGIEDPSSVLGMVIDVPGETLSVGACCESCEHGGECEGCDG